MHALDILGEPVRRRLFELMSHAEQPAGEVGAVVEREFTIGQSAVSQHLKVLRDTGLVTVRVEGTRRLYAINPQALNEVEAWAAECRQFWNRKLDALGTELARGRRGAKKVNRRTKP